MIFLFAQPLTPKSIFLKKKMKNYFLLIGCLLGLLGCNKEEQRITTITEGTYTGSFQRELSWAKSDTSIITLTFTSTNWSGTSDKFHYPALCNGTYTIEGDSVNFENSCVWTAEFDWSLILSGKYAITISGETIEFTREYRSSTAEIYRDRYRIRKVE
jgi:hypothetical protein